MQVEQNYSQTMQATSNTNVVSKASKVPRSKITQEIPQPTADEIIDKYI